MDQTTPPRVVVLGPDLGAVSGISTHLRHLLGSRVGVAFDLVHFQTGGEGRAPEGRAATAWRLLSAPLALAWVLVRTRARLVHVNSAMERKAFWRDVPFVLVARALGRHVVLQVHGGHLPADFARGVPGGGPVLRRLLRLPHDLVLLAEVERVAYLAFDDRLRVRVVPNAIEAPGPPTSRPRRTEPERLELVYVGRLARDKGIFEAATAAGQAVARGLDVRMTYAGAGPDEAALREAVADLPEGTVRFLGPVFGQDKDDLWHGSDVFVFPTYHREGLPYALLEAMATDTLVITTRVGGIPDVVDETQAILVEPRRPDSVVESIAWVHDHRDEAARITRAARQRVEEAYLVDRLAEDFLALFRDALAGRAPRGTMSR